ncbi:MAG: tetratricopeptide repeat protein [Candidatus Marinimicrobia bacterium]|nr:tetratricopeptide repeat protein [Candidatus Neomarinimicrobiota bacterium]
MKILLFIIILSTTFIIADENQADENYFFLGEYYLLQEDYSKAEEYYLLALKQDPGSIEIFNTLIDLSLQTKDYEKALTYVLESITFSPLDDKLIDMAINLYAYLDQTDSAYQLIENKIQEYPENIDLIMKKLAILVSEYKWKEVIESCVDILLIDPENQEIYQTMMEIGFRTDEFDGLLSGLDILMDRYPDEVVFVISYIRILYGIGDQSQILNELWELNTRFPKNVIILNQLAQQLNDSENFNLADSIYIQLIEEDDPEALALNNYAYNLCARDGVSETVLDQALKYGSLALENSPDNASYLDTVGWIYFQMGEYELAEHFLIASLTIDQENAIIYEHLSDVYAKAKQVRKAVEALDKAIAIDQDNEQLKEKRTLLSHE